MNGIVLSISLPLPPSVNSMYEGGSGQKRYKSKQYKAWYTECFWLVKTLPKVKEYPVELWIKIVWPTNRSCDLSNRIKAIEDLLVNAGILLDDDRKHIRRIVITDGGVDKASAGAYITIKE